MSRRSPDPDSSSSKPKKRILVVGAGAAGMSCTEQLSHHTDKYQITLVEAVDYCGGQAFSIPIDEKKHGASWMNQGVQGGSYIYHHTFHMFKQQGRSAEPVELEVSFGTDEKFWTNSFPTELVAKHQHEIKRFKKAIEWMRRFEVFFAIIPIKKSLKMFRFSDEFINYMIYPSLALFLGTGNATPDLPSVMMERLYTSPTYGMWYPVDEKSLSSNQPPMVVFPEETAFYTGWKETLEERGVTIRLNTEVVSIPERSNKRVRVQIRERVDGQKDAYHPTVEEEYDEIVLCVLADTAQRLLGKGQTFMEKRVLGKTKWSDDITVTHTDLDYMKKWYTLDMPEDLPSNLSGRDESERIAKARRKGFNPMYLIKQVPADPKLLEMSFDCSNFQYQLKEANKPQQDHIFQSIFLNKKNQDTWTMDEIDKDKIIRKDWWHQLEHRWTHYAFVVPFMSFLNGKKHTRYAAAWTLVNAHELAVISGLAAAYALGASYPRELMEDSFAVLCFRLYLLFFHRIWFSKKDNEKRLGGKL